MSPTKRGVRILVAGATGNLGRPITAELVHRGYLVRAMGRDPARVAKVGAQETAVADARDRRSLVDACSGVDVVFSCLGASVHLSPRFGRQTLSSLDVAANINLLDAARQARVLRFAYVSVFGAERLGHLDYVRGHEEVVCALRESRLDYVVIRPTGVFSAFEQMLHIARLGAMPEIRSGAARSNPIDDRDLAAACVDALEGEDGERSIGGPETLSRREMGLLAFEAVGLPPRFRPTPAWMFRGAGWLARPFNPRISHLLNFYAALGENDLVAPPHGHRRLREYFQERAAWLFNGPAVRHQPVAQ